MILGTYTFYWTPDQYTVPKAERRSSSLKTFISEIFFSYGSTIVGVVVTLEWDAMPAAQFDALDVLYQADLPVLWALEVIGEMDYIVEITRLDGELEDVSGYEFPYRRKVKMDLLILSETAGAMS